MTNIASLLKLNLSAFAVLLFVLVTSSMAQSPITGQVTADADTYADSTRKDSTLPGRDTILILSNDKLFERFPIGGSLNASTSYEVIDFSLTINLASQLTPNSTFALQVYVSSTTINENTLTYNNSRAPDTLMLPTTAVVSSNGSSFKVTGSGLKTAAQAAFDSPSRTLSLAFTAAGQTYVISREAGQPAQVDYTVKAVPEPTIVNLLFGSLATFYAFRRKRM